MARVSGQGRSGRSFEALRKPLRCMLLHLTGLRRRDSPSLAVNRKPCSTVRAAFPRAAQKTRLRYDGLVLFINVPSLLVGW